MTITGGELKKLTGGAHLRRRRLGCARKKDVKNSLRNNKKMEEERC